MELTIHYELQADIRSPKKARKLVEQLQQKALNLPFKEVSDVIDLRKRKSTGWTGKIPFAG